MINEKLIKSVKENNLQEVKNCLAQGADVNAKESDSNGNTALILASQNNNFDIVKLLIEHGADVNAKNNDGETLLKWVLENKNFDIYQYLVENSDIEDNAADFTNFNIYKDKNEIKNNIKFGLKIICYNIKALFKSIFKLLKSKICPQRL